MPEMQFYGGYPYTGLEEYKDAIRLANRELEIYCDIDHDVLDWSGADFYRDLRLLELQDAEATITVHIKSNGGSVYDGLHLYDDLTSVKAPLVTIGHGIVASAATFPFLAGDERILQPHSWFLIHEISSAEWGKISEQEDSLNQQKKMLKQVIAIYEKHSNMTARQIKAKMDRKEWWLSAEEAVNYGLADRIA